ncbi:pyridoxal-phosphate dependent enzyme [Bacillus changyiensis]|uniref:pyridoxal-phosphate dependent enzyme n=1 Tax=Bacillus changyiensis TaxID=3004103 RepID=UPI0022E2C7F9|nr:pyridoxal-phosphate dependent enzyme [Bacillus changyiensis]MDA1477993.1 pyridoxal-phosphate dependent enzyme [Bacillus changyiensis]
MILNNITDCIGNTPVVELKDDLVSKGKKLYLKLDYFNPNFSVKDRTAYGLVQAAFHEGKLKRGGVLIESTSGNLGKSLAMLGAVYQFKVIIVVDPKISPTVLNWYKAYGAHVEMVKEPAENGGFQQARITRVKQLLEQYPEAYWPNQYDNPDNPSFHYVTTAKEIVELSVDSVVGAVSTGGHLCGIGKRVKKERTNMKVVACDVKGSAVFDHRFRPYLINGVGLSWRGHNTDITVIDQVSIASDRQAISTCNLIAKEHGIMVGGSGGLVIFTALAWLNQSNCSSAVAVIPDAGVNYLDQIYNEEWRKEKGLDIMNRAQLKATLDQQLFMIPEEKQESLSV